MARNVKKGWQPDPASPGQERYWDGKNWTEQRREARPQRKKRRGGSVIKVALGVILGLTVLIVGCAAIIGSSADKAIKDTQKQSDKTGITATQFKAVKIGTLRSDVRSQLVVPPEDKDSTAIQDYKSECLYYNRKGHLFDIYQFCFENHRLVSKSSF